MRLREVCLTKCGFSHAILRDFEATRVDDVRGAVAAAAQAIELARLLGIAIK